MEKFFKKFIVICIACISSLNFIACGDDDDDHKHQTPTPTQTQTPTSTPTPKKTKTVTPTPTITPTSTAKNEFDTTKTACAELGIAKKTKIINGVTCDSSNASIAKLIITTLTGNVGLCTGTVITSNTVLTAAHCLSSSIASVKITVGEKEYNATRKAVNPLYLTNPSPSSQYYYDRNDVALLQIDETFEVNPIPIITSRTPKLNETLAVAGYGQDENGGTGVLKAAYMNVYNTYESGFVLAYNETQTNVCFGDSGGPAFGYVNGRVGVYGTTNAGSVNNCLDGDETFFPQLSYSENLNFILNYVIPEQI